MQNDKTCQSFRTYDKRWVDTHCFLKTLKEKISVNWYISKTLTIFTCSKDKNCIEPNTEVLKCLTSITIWVYNRRKIYLKGWTWAESWLSSLVAGWPLVNYLTSLSLIFLVYKIWILILLHRITSNKIPCLKQSQKLLIQG